MNTKEAINATELINDVFTKQKAHYLTQKNTSAEERINLLRKFQMTLVGFERKLIEAMSKDLEKPEFETFAFEFGGTLAAIEDTCKNLENWMKPKFKPATINPDGLTELRPEAKGIVLIIGPWNFPFLLIMEPLIASIAAGNCSIIKPSELTPNISYIIVELIQTAFSPEVVAVIEGGVEETTEILKQPFDHIFFTGSTTVGKIIMTAAAKNLSSVTLELGGKNPFIIDKDADIEKSIVTLLHKKFMNSGQICLAPDFVFIKKEQETEFLEQAQKVLTEMYYYDGVFHKEDTSKIINERNYNRLKNLYSDAISKGSKVIAGGKFDDKNHRIEPTIITDVTTDCLIMQEEIFGPILPVMNYNNLDEVIEFVNNGGKPLALYMFSNNNDNVEKILSYTSSGGVTINECMMQALDINLPFGGVNGSGMGVYHGEYGFRELSHYKPIWHNKNLNNPLDKTLYPPFVGKVDVMKKMMGLS